MNTSKKLSDKELEQVTGGASNQSETVYSLTVEGSGAWKDGAGMPVTSITVADDYFLLSGETITYKNVSGIECSVKATPNADYSFRGCSFNASTHTFHARFSSIG